MDLRVADETSAPHDALVGMAAGAERLSRLQVVRVTLSHMTLLAEERYRRHQQRRLIRAVRRMTVQAVLAHWCVLEQERTALLRMALIAGLVYRVRFEQGRGERTVRIVATGALHLLLAQRMVRGLHQCLPDLLVALCAQLLLRGLR